MAPRIRQFGPEIPSQIHAVDDCCKLYGRKAPSRAVAPHDWKMLCVIFLGVVILYLFLRYNGSILSLSKIGCQFCTRRRLLQQLRLVHRRRHVFHDCFSLAGPLALQGFRTLGLAAPLLFVGDSYFPCDYLLRRFSQEGIVLVRGVVPAIRGRALVHQLLSYRNRIRRASKTSPFTVTSTSHQAFRPCCRS